MIRIILYIFIIALFSTRSTGQTSIIKYLSGTDKDHTVAWDFFCTRGMNSGKWGKINVPSCWETQGYGTYHYGWEENYKENESGFYKLNFTSDPSWKNMSVRIVFEGSMTDTEVKINGRLAGPKHQGSFYRFKYDITSLLKEQNTLDFKVDKISSDTSVNRAERMSDFWVFGGIHRPVYLEILPKQYIDWVAIDAKADGSFVMNVYTTNVKNAMTLEAQIKTLNGQPVGAPFSGSVAKSDVQAKLATRVNQPKLWSPEFPNRYMVEIRLKDGRGIVHTITEKFGFRTVEFKEEDGFYVNDKKVIFKGINRHTSWPSAGRTTSKQISILDVNLIKDMNMNAVRMSHYPPEIHFLDVCDSLGLFVLDELAGWQKKYDTPVGKKLVREMVIRDVNHPSIIIWDNGNEGGNNHELVQEYSRYDPQNRKVIHPWNVFQGTDTQHYKGYDCCVGSLNHGANVFFPTEFLHGLQDGGHGAGLDDHWQLNEQNSLFAGVFLWAFADEGVVRLDKDSIVDIKETRAPDGIVGPYRQKEGSFYTVKEIWSPIKIKEEKLQRDFSGRLSVVNKYLYTNLSDIRFRYQLAVLPTPGATAATNEIINEGVFQGPPLPPGESGFIQIPVTSFEGAEVLYLTATDPWGRTVFKWSWPLKNTKSLNHRLFLNSGSGSASADVNGPNIKLLASDVAVTINTETGMIASVMNGATSISFSNGPALSTGSFSVKSFKHYQMGNDYVVEIFPQGELQNLRYIMQGNGILKIEFSYSLYGMKGPKEFDFMGINFNYPEDKITGITLAGRGPYRVWKNRMKGNEYGVWKKEYNNTVTGESWDYPEFKGYYRDFQWVVIENNEQPFLIYTENDNLFLRLYTPQKANAANYNTAPAFPAGDISILHAINGIGTKFDDASFHGPQGQKNKIGWVPIQSTIYLDFRNPGRK